MPSGSNKRKKQARVAKARMHGFSGQDASTSSAPIRSSLLKKRYWKYTGAFWSARGTAALLMAVLMVYLALNGMLLVSLLVLALLALLLIAPFDEGARIAYRGLSGLLHGRYDCRSVAIDHFERIVNRGRGDPQDLTRLRLYDRNGEYYICCLDRSIRFLYEELDGTLELNVTFMAKSRLLLLLSASYPIPKEVKAQYQLTILTPLLNEYRP